MYTRDVLYQSRSCPSAIVRAAIARQAISLPSISLPAISLPAISLPAISLQLLMTALFSFGLSAQNKILKDIFTGFDSNKDGTVTRREFPGSDAQWKAMDKNKDGKATLLEFEKSPTGRRIFNIRRKDASAPRKRIDVDALVLARLDQIKSYDRNRDRRVTKTEWLGSPEAFRTLDLDRDGDLDRHDRAIAKSRASVFTLPKLPDIKSSLGTAEGLLKSLDKNKDKKLSKAEVRGNRLKNAFAFADQNRDESIDIEELKRTVTAVNTHLQARQRGYAKPKAYRVPFDSWDKNHNERLERSEWISQENLFGRIDHNRDAAVTRDEIARYIKSVEGDSFIARFDMNADGRVTAKEFGGPASAFRRADRNGDGSISRADR